MIQRKIYIAILVLVLGFVLVPKAYGCDPNTTPVVILHIDPCEAIVGQQVICDGSGSYIIEGEITQYDFCFDYKGGWTTYGYTETEANAPDGTFDGKTPHTYNVAGTYTVKLRANGRTDTCTVHVRGVHNITQDEWYSSIQAALNDANDNDVIEVGEGTWNEAIDFNGVNCTVRSRDPNDWDVVSETIIDAENLNSCVVTFHSGETNNAVLSGFTLKGGNCGVHCSNSSNPVIEHCIITDNHPYGAACNISSSPTIASNQIMGNINGNVLYSLPLMSYGIDNFMVCKNYEGTAGFVSTTTDAMICSNMILDDVGSGIEAVSGAEPKITNCILWNNGLKLPGGLKEGDNWEETSDVGVTGAVAEPDYKADEIIVKFKKPVSDALEQQLAGKVEHKNIKLSASLDSINRKYNVRAFKPVFKDFKANRERMNNLLKKDAKLLNSDERKLLKRLQRAPKGTKLPELDRIYRVELEAGQSVEQAVAEYSKDSGVEYAELNYMVHTCLAPNDPNYQEQWPLNNTGQMYPGDGTGRFREPPGTTGCDANAPEAWDIHTGSSEIIVAVIDTGVDYNHRDLQGNMWMDANGCHGYDFANDDNDPMDDHGHGTHCAGVIAARTNNSLDIAGVSWNAKIMAVKFLSASGSGTDADGAAAIYYAVANGADVLSNSWGGTSSSQTLKEAVNHAYSSGAIFVAAAGNSNSNSPSFYPANYDHVISVAATDSNDDRGYFSNYGSWVDIAAPGVDILSLRAFMTAMGTPYGLKLTIASGTSMACPHVAGACALVLSVDSRLSCNDVNEILRNNADTLQNPNICASGRLDVYEAILGTVSSNGYINLDKPYYGCDTDIGILVSDLDLAGNGVCDVNLTTDGGDWEVVTLSEIGTGVGIFTGSITTSSGDPYSGDGILQVADGQTITGTYYDANDDTGNPAEPNDTAAAECNAPVISNVSFAEGPIGQTQTVTFQTDELCTVKIICGTSCGESDIIVERIQPQLNHNIKFKGTEPSTDYYFKIEATDLAGNVTADSNDGNCYWFVTNEGPSDINVPGDCNTIQEAIDIAWDGTTIWLADGNYTGTGNRDVDFKGVGATVRSVNGPNNCIIDCQGTETETHRAFIFANEEGTTSALKDLTITGGYATITEDYCGGAIKIVVASPRIENCIFRENWGWWGGAIYNNFGAPEINNCTFAENEGAYGGAIFNSLGLLTITNSILSENTTTAWGGAIMSYPSATLVANDCIFSENGASTGGAIYQRAGIVTVTNSTFCKNTALYSGGGVYHYIPGGVQTFTNCVFSGNLSINGSGGGILNSLAITSRINNCTFSQNTAKKAGGLYFVSTKQYLTNCILWGNSDDSGTNESAQISTSSSSNYDPNINYSCVQGWTGDYGGQGNIGTNPEFVNARGPDGIPGTEDDNLRLLAGSGCIDTGTNDTEPNLPDTDRDGNSRILNSIVDMGAYEGPHQGCVLSVENVNISENGEGTFTVSLAMDPCGTVVVTVSIYSGDSDITVQSGAVLTFNSSNYSTPQTVTLAAAEDGDNLNGTVVIQISSDIGTILINAAEVDNDPVADILYVDANAPGVNTGANWAEAYTKLSDALDVASSHGNVSEIRVAEGTYKPTEPNGDRFATFQLPVDITLQGGYAGYGESDPNARDIDAYETVLSGDIQGNDTGNWDDESHEDNSYHVVTGANNITLDGFTISGGYGISEFGNLDGGGMYNESNCNTMITNCIFKDNSAGYGGGIYNVYDSNCALTNCTFSGNHAAQGAGGGIRNDYRSKPTVINCKFFNNTAWSYGGGISSSGDCDANIVNCLFYGNSVDYYGGAVSNWSANSQLTNCTISNNEAEYGGGIYNFGDTHVLSNCILWDNDANNAGDEIYNYSGVSTVAQISYCDIKGSGGSDNWDPNLGTDLGYNIDADPNFVNPDANDFHLNPGSSCIDEGDPNSNYTGQKDIDGEPRVEGLYVDMGADEAAVIGVDGAGIKCISSSPRIVWCIISDNSHSGISCQGSSNPIITNNIIGYNDYDGISAHVSAPTIKNNWIYNNSFLGIRLNDPNSTSAVSNNTMVGNSYRGIGYYDYNRRALPAISNCILWNDDDLDFCSATYSCISDCNDVGDPNETHNTCADPCFVDADANDFHLDANSPCIDVGDPNGNYSGQKDIDGDDRVIDISGKGDGVNDVDMGADEYNDD